MRRDEQHSRIKATESEIQMEIVYWISLKYFIVRRFSSDMSVQLLYI